MTLKNTKIDALILCGGLGKRLSKVVKDRQKCIAEVNGQSFLDFLIEYLQNYGIKKLILCLGYKADTVRSNYGKKTKKIKILFSEEKYPLGTAGAVKNAESLIRSNPFLVLNGDSICRIDLSDFLRFHKRKKALASVVLVKSKHYKHNKDFGTVQLGRSQKIIHFCEKTERRGVLINGGIYLFEKEILSLIPQDRYYSLEYDLFPILLKRFYGYETGNILIDIGTPRRYKKAKKILINKLL